MKRAAGGTRGTASAADNERAEHARVMAMARAERAKNGGGPLEVGHRCTEACQTVGTRRIRVCLASLNTHVCPGASCPFVRHTGEARVCGLSGFEVAGPDDAAVTSFSTTNGVTAQLSRHWGHAVKTTAAPQRRASVRESDQMTRTAIEEQVRRFLASGQRGDICLAERKKVRENCVKAAKMLREPPSFAQVVGTVHELYAARAALCRGAAPADAPWLLTLASAIFEFWKGIREEIPMKKKNAAAFTAAVLTFMSGSGLEHSGVVYIRPSPLVAAHCPRPRQFAAFRSMTCRRITQQIRSIKAALTLPSGRPRVVPPLEFG